MHKTAEKLQIKFYATGEKTPEKTFRNWVVSRGQWQISVGVSWTFNIMRLNYLLQSKNYCRGTSLAV